MSSTNRRWTLNEAEVAAKVIEEEAIILNLSTGLYYSLDGVGADVWGMLVERRSFDEIVTTLAEAYQEAHDRIETDVEQLIADLVQEQLIVACHDAPSPAAEWNPPSGLKARSYAAPLLAKHTDMADLLALDPPMPGLMDGPWIDSPAQR